MIKRMISESQGMLSCFHRELKRWEVENDYFCAVIRKNENKHIQVQEIFIIGEKLARKKREWRPGARYHVMSCGNRRAEIYAYITQKSGDSEAF